MPLMKLKTLTAQTVALQVNRRAGMPVCGSRLATVPVLHVSNDVFIAASMPALWRQRDRS